jgi:iron complex outermembrane receptor protein
MAFRLEAIKSRRRFPATAANHRSMTSWLLASTILCCASTGLSSQSFAQQPVLTSAQNGTVRFSIPAQPLPAALDAFIHTTGWQLGYSTRIADGLRSAAVNGTMPPAQALRALLAGTGINVRLTGVNTATLLAPNAIGSIPEGAIPLSTISVIGEGTADQGYRVETAKTTGPWGDKPILDTPYSIHVTSAELMENMIAGTSDQLINFNPLIKPDMTSIYSGQPGRVIRGFRQSAFSAFTLDGVPINSTYLGGDTEGMERMEVLSGLSGFLYGAGNVGGMVNYVTKRPTAAPLANLTVGNYGGSQYFSHLDLGGPIDKEGKFAYRFNALYQDGKTPIGIGLRRADVNGAVDWNVTDSLKVSVTAGHNDYMRSGTSGLSFTAPGPIPSAKNFDNTRPMTPNWGFNHLVQDRVGGTLHWDIDDDTTLRAGALYLEQTRVASASPVTMALLPDGMYRYNAFFNEGPTQKNTGGYLYVDRKIDTFGIQHKLTFGTNFSAYNVLNSYGPALFTFFSAEYPTLIAAQNSPPLPLAPIERIPEYLQSHYMNSNIVLGDDITLNRYFSILVGMNRSTISTVGYASTGAVTSSYGKSAVTPSASLIFKPTSNVSLYGTYIESLESGGIVPLTAIPPYANAGAILQPTISKQVEFGAKANVGGVFLTLASFQIDKANIYDVANPNGTLTRNQDGREIHKGIEFTATGKVTDDLTIMGGGTFLDAETTKTTNPALLGKTPFGVSKWRLALWGEYRLPFLQRLFLTGGVNYVGSSYLDAVNTLLVPAYTVGDVGLRYETAFNGTPVIMRLNVQNVTDNHYWQSAGTTLNLGFPRTYSFSATAKF